MSELLCEKMDEVVKAKCVGVQCNADGSKTITFTTADERPFMFGGLFALVELKDKERER